MLSRTRPKRQWHVLPAPPAPALRALGAYPPLIARLLYNRGVRTAAEAQAFLEARRAPADAAGLPGTDAAVRRIAQAVRSGETIAIYGDFDADGVTASALLWEALKGFGVQPVIYIPDRVTEGHGLNLGALQELRRLGARLVVTADCGVTNASEVAAAADLGMDVVITDHHTPPPALPSAAAVVDPKRAGSSEALRGLSAVGVAYVLSEALARELARPADPTLLEFVALGTVADLAPLAGQNRALVREGLRSLGRTKRPGLLALLAVAGLEPKQVDTEAISFSLGPRINAPGRLDHASPSFRLLTAASLDEARPLAEQVNAANADRQRQTAEVLAAVAQRAEAIAGRPLIFLGDPEFPPGIIGLAAGKLTEEHYRPAVVCSVRPQETRGSCRSIPEFNIIEALQRCDGLFARYGGHAQAAGFTIATERLPELERRLTAIAAETLGQTDLRPRLVIDAEVPLSRIDGTMIRAMRELAPFGAGNPQPAFVARRAEVREARTMGAEGRHLRLKLREGAVTWVAVAFNAPELPQPAPPFIDLVFTLGIDRLDGREMLRLNVLDLAPAA
jgi:single-stranded-DNA-specific exonuclease